MSPAARVITITFVLAVILDLYIVFFHKKFRAYLQQRQIASGRATMRQRVQGWLLPARAFLADLWKNLWLDERRAFQVVTAIASIAGSVIIGTMYAGVIGIPIYPIVLWLIEIVICCLLLFPFHKKTNFGVSPIWPQLIGLLTVAFLLRSIGLSILPPGFHTDEHGTAQFVQHQVLNPLNQGLTVNPFMLDSNNQPVLYDYVWRLSIGVFGFTISGARMASAIAGTLAALAVFFMVNEMAGRRLAWYTAILMAVYHYHVHWSRIALNNIWVTLWLPLTIAFFLRGWRKRWSGDAVLAGLCLGFTAYFYAGGYFILILLPILIWQEWKKAPNRVRFAIYCGKMLAVALVVAAPIIVFAIRFPSHFLFRTSDIVAWKVGYAQEALDSMDATTWDLILYQFRHSFGAYNFYSDITGFYKPEIPFLIGLASAVFLWGIAWTIYKKQYFPLIWVAVVTIMGGVMSAGTPGSSHFIGVIPAICWLAAVPLDWLTENGHKRLAFALLFVICLTDLIFYFLVYKSSPSPDLSLKFPLVESCIR
ncbi:MAG: glycosyltransferase family 39 protein [Chloroflexi bacterium]|nr:glycosyltransferase family 39 protein [Chloroflexota bacterium]